MEPLVGYEDKPKNGDLGLYVLCILIFAVTVGGGLAVALTWGDAPDYTVPLEGTILYTDIDFDDLKEDCAPAASAICAKFDIVITGADDDNRHTTLMEQMYIGCSVLECRDSAPNVEADFKLTFDESVRLYKTFDAAEASNTKQKETLNAAEIRRDAKELIANDTYLETSIISYKEYSEDREDE